MVRKLTDYEQDIVDYMSAEPCFQTTREIYKGIHLFEGDLKDLERLSKSLWHLCNDDKILQSQSIPNDRHNRKMYKIMTNDTTTESIELDESIIEDKKIDYPTIEYTPQSSLKFTLSTLRLTIKDIEKFVHIDEIDHKVERLRDIGYYMNAENCAFLNAIADDIERLK
jgi:hypothetical protein